MSHYIVVHPGSAHMDEVLATGLIGHSEGLMPVFRRQPTDEELNSADVWVVDVGERHDPARLDFDHHQDDPAVAEECALSLVARHLGLHELLCTRPWYPTQIFLDVHGQTGLARRLGIGASLPDELNSPVEMALVSSWESAGSGQVDDDLVRMVTRFVTVLVEEARGFGDELLRAREKTEVRTIRGMEVLFHDCVTRDSVSEHLRREWEAREGRSIAASVSRDPRQPHGWALYRIDDDPRVDFRRLRDDPDVHFAHAKGFVAKTKPGVDKEQLEPLLARAFGSNESV